MINVSIHHKTTYRFNKPVALGPHRLILRPRESRELRLVSSQINLTPDATLSWAQDVFGNAVATATFRNMATELEINSLAQIQLDAVAWPIFDIAVSAMSYPFRYSDDEWTDLGALTIPQFGDAAGTLKSWALKFVLGPTTDTLSLLKDLSTGTSEAVQYQSRDDEGTQAPVETLNCGFGSCRDIAVLFTEASRSLGFGARIVSGYLHNPHQQSIGSGGAGSTHAWAEVYIPGGGWITFDPTNRSLGGNNLIPVAVVRDIRQAAPISGSFSGASNSFINMEVEVTVTS